MDMQLATSETIINGVPVWTVVIQNGIVPLISGNAEQTQRAALATFVLQNTIPGLPGQGVPWLSFLAGNASFSDVDSKVRQNLSNANAPFTPTYSVLNSKIQCTLQQVTP